MNFGSKLASCKQKKRSTQGPKSCCLKTDAMYRFPCNLTYKQASFFFTFLKRSSQGTRPIRFGHDFPRFPVRFAAKEHTADHSSQA